MKLKHIISILAFSLVAGMLFSCVTDINPIAFSVPLAGAGFAHALGYIQLPAGSLMLNFGAITTITTPEIDGRESMGGYTSIAYLALINDIEGFPSEPDVETIQAVIAAAKLTGAYTMKQDKYFYMIRVKPRSIQFTPEGQGEVGGKSFKVRGSFMIPGIDDESMGLARVLNNRYGILILPDPDGKNRINIGTNALPCEFSATGESGQAAADAKGFTFNFECDSFAPGWIYNGAIPLSGSTVGAIS